MNRLTNAAKCAMACQEPMFRAFLKHKLEGASPHIQAEPWYPMRDKDHAAVAVRYLLDIDSRRDLDTDTDALRRWWSLRQEFETWEGQR